MRVAILTTDNRSAFQKFDLEKPWFGYAPSALFEGLSLMPGLEVHVVTCTRQTVAAPGKLADNIWFHSLHVPKIGWMRTGYLGCCRAIRRRLKQIQPDLVHGQGSEFEAALCAAYSGYPNVITLLGIMREMKQILHSRPGSFHWCAAVLESIALRRTAGVLANSRYTEEKILSRTPRTWLIPNAVRSEFFDVPLPETGPRECVLLNVGTVCSYKRQNELLDVLDQLQNEGFKFRMLFVGAASPENPYAQTFLAWINTRSYVSHIEAMSSRELIQCYDSASALIHVSAIESFGLAVAEALSRNLKLFGFKLGGVADIGEGVEGAELSGDQDWAALKTNLARWLRAGSPRPNSAADTIRSRYHPVEIARQHLAVYEEVLRERAVTSGIHA